MGQESLIEGILRSLRKNIGWTILIIVLSMTASFLYNRFSPPLYQSSSLLRVMTATNLSEKDIAAEMNGVLSQKEIQDKLVEKCKIDENFVKSGKLANISASGAGLITLTVKYKDPSMLKEIGTSVIRILSDHFISYNTEAHDFFTKALQAKLERLENSITGLRKQIITTSVIDEIQSNSDIVDLENRIQFLEEKIDASSKLLQTTPRMIFYYVEEESPQYKSVKQQLNKARNELAELYKTYMDKHPKVIACQNKIKALEYKLSKSITKVKKQKSNPDFQAINAEIQNDKQQLCLLKEELLIKRKLATANLSSDSTEGLNLRISALEDLHRKTIIQLEESKISQTTNSGRINVLKKDQRPPQIVGFSPIQRDCIALILGILIAIFLLYTPAPIKTELIGISAKALNSSPEPQIELDTKPTNTMNSQPTQVDAEPAEIILEVSALTPEPLSLPCLLTEEEALSLKYDERLVSLNEPNSPILKPYKELVSNLQISMSETQTRIVIACSAKEGTGKTTMIANVGVLLAQAGYSVLLIDANFRNPSIHRMFGVDNVNGLSNLLTGEKPYNVIQKSPIEDMSIISSGIAPELPEETLSSPEMIKLLGSLKRRFEIILIDTPALLQYPEASALAGQTGAVVFLHREGESEDNLKNSKKILNDVGAKVFGYVKI